MYKVVELSHWDELRVLERHRVTGCIPTGFDSMIRYSGIEGVNLDVFQEDLDLFRSGRDLNRFVNIFTVCLSRSMSHHRSCQASLALTPVSSKSCR